MEVVATSSLQIWEEGNKGTKGRTLCETLQKTILMINMQKVRGSGDGRGQVHTETRSTALQHLRKGIPNTTIGDTTYQK